AAWSSGMPWGAGPGRSSAARATSLSAGMPWAGGPAPSIGGAEAMKVRYRVYEPGQPERSAEAELPPRPGLDQLKAVIMPLLGCEQMEHVWVLWEGRQADMFVDETGVLKGLPENQVASAIYRAAFLRRNPGANPNALPAIHGTAVLFESQVWW
ncbi:MAG: hypothetical protein JWR10_430, partial [Rubritepida sp.]|nr:hypothetical protein [Rubritepida sp.]